MYLETANPVGCVLDLQKGIKDGSSLETLVAHDSATERVAIASLIECKVYLVEIRLIYLNYNGKHRHVSANRGFRV